MSLRPATRREGFNGGFGRTDGKRAAASKSVTLLGEISAEKGGRTMWRQAVDGRTGLTEQTIEMAISKVKLTTRRCLGIFLGILASTFTIAQESTDPDTFRKLYQEFRALAEKDLDEATKFVESKIAEKPDSIDRNVFRQSLASRLLDQRRFQDAEDQLAKLLDFQIRRIDLSENRLGVWMTLRDLRQTATDKEMTEAIGRGYEALQGLGAKERDASLFPITQLATMKAQSLAAADEDEAALTLVNEVVQDLIQRNRKEDANVETTQSLISALRELTTDAAHNDLWRDQCVDSLDEYVTVAIEKYPQSVEFQNSYANTQLKMITRWGQDDPDATEERIELVTGKLNPLATRNRSIQAILRRIDVYKQRIEDAKPPESLVGKPAPPWEIDAWVDGVDRDFDSFKGKVVLIDFWAMWCGPCIATFPHLREWREEFGGQGFEIVGVTQYYNFRWDDLNQKAMRNQDPVDPADERETIKKFLEHHQLAHPVFVTPEKSEMSSEYGVRGIPHVVLIDREGIVQLIRTGAGPDTAKAIHEKIEELVAPKSP
jgi:thiol-disulfide isomerase/thioredoxin